MASHLVASFVATAPVFGLVMLLSAPMPELIEPVVPAEEPMVVASLAPVAGTAGAAPVVVVVLGAVYCDVVIGAVVAGAIEEPLGLDELLDGMVVVVLGAALLSRLSPKAKAVLEIARTEAAMKTGASLRMM